MYSRLIAERQRGARGTRSRHSKPQGIGISSSLKRLASERTGLHERFAKTKARETTKRRTIQAVARHIVVSGDAIALPGGTTIDVARIAREAGIQAKLKNLRVSRRDMARAIERESKGVEDVAEATSAKLRDLQTSVQQQLSKKRWYTAASWTKMGFSVLVTAIPPAAVAEALGLSVVVGGAAVALAYGTVQTVVLTFMENRAASSDAERKANLTHNVASNCVTAVIAASTGALLGTMEGEMFWTAGAVQAGAYAFGTGIVGAVRKLRGMETTPEIYGRLEAAEEAERKRNLETREQVRFLRNAVSKGASPMEAAAAWQAYAHPTLLQRFKPGGKYTQYGWFTLKSSVGSLVSALGLDSKLFMLATLISASSVFLIRYVIQYGATVTMGNIARLVADMSVQVVSWGTQGVLGGMGRFVLMFLSTRVGQAIVVACVTRALRRVDMLNRLQGLVAGSAARGTSWTLRKLRFSREFAYLIGHGIVGSGIQAFIAGTQHKYVSGGVRETFGVLYPPTDADGNPQYEPGSAGDMLQRAAAKASKAREYWKQAPTWSNVASDVYASAMHEVSTNAEWLLGATGVLAASVSDFGIDAYNRLYEGITGTTPPPPPSALEQMQADRESLLNTYDTLLTAGSDVVSKEELASMTRLTAEYMRASGAVMQSEDPNAAATAQHKELRAMMQNIEREDAALTPIIQERIALRNAAAVDAAVSAGRDAVHIYLKRVNWGSMEDPESLTFQMASSAGSEGWAAARSALDRGFNEYQAGVAGRRVARDAARNSVDALTADHGFAAADKAWSAIEKAAGKAGNDDGTFTAMEAGVASANREIEEVFGSVYTSMSKGVEQGATQALSNWVKERKPTGPVPSSTAYDASVDARVEGSTEMRVFEDRVTLTGYYLREARQAYDRARHQANTAGIATETSPAAEEAFAALKAARAEHQGARKDMEAKRSELYEAARRGLGEDPRGIGSDSFAERFKQIAATNRRVNQANYRLQKAKRTAHQSATAEHQDAVQRAEADLKAALEGEKYVIYRQMKTEGWRPPASAEKVEASLQDARQAADTAQEKTRRDSTESAEAQEDAFVESVRAEHDLEKAERAAKVEEAIREAPVDTSDVQVKESAPSAESITVETETTTAEPEAIAAEPETTTAEPEATAVEPEPRTVEPEATAVESEPRTVEPEATAVEPEPRTVEPEARDATRPLHEQGVPLHVIESRIQRAADSTTREVLRARLSTLTTETDREAFQSMLRERFKLSEITASRLAKGTPRLEEVTEEDIENLTRLQNGMRKLMGDKAFGCVPEDATCWHRSASNVLYEVTAYSAPVVAAAVPAALGGVAVAGVSVLCPMCGVAAAPWIYGVASAASAKAFVGTSAATVLADKTMANPMFSPSGEVGGFYNIKTALTQAALHPGEVWDAALGIYRADGIVETVEATVNGIADVPGLQDLMYGNDDEFLAAFEGGAAEWQEALDAPVDTQPDT